MHEQKKTENTKQENKTLEQSQSLFPLHFHSHLYFIIPVRILMLVKVNLNPGLLLLFLFSLCMTVTALQQHSPTASHRATMIFAAMLC